MNQKGFTPILIILGIILVIGIVAGTYYFRISQTPKTSTKQPYSSKPEDNSKQNLEAKPDLIIEKISYKNAKVHSESYGMPVMFPGKNLDFTITVKNIGNADFKSSFYVSNSRSERDFADNYHSHSELANQKEQKIPANESLDVTVSDIIDSDTKNVQFSINYRSKTDKKDVPMAIRDESNYENNSYQLTIN